jgi:hypothetical protein
VDSSKNEKLGLQVYLEVSHASSLCLMETTLEYQETRLTQMAYNITNRGTVWTELQAQKLWKGKHSWRLFIHKPTS